MNKFWAVVTIMIAVGLGLLLAQGSNPVNFTDLETECQYDRGEEFDIDLRGDRLYFSGHFPANNPDLDLSYSYSQSNEHVKLNIEKANDSPLDSFKDNCRAVAVYDGYTREKLDEGRYTVELEHAGEEVDKRIIRVD